MPIFEYRCSKCDEVFEELVLSRNTATVKCPSCGGQKVQPLISRFAAQTGGKSDSGACFNQAAGVCQAGGGAMT
jgi:putative FmdB family regulatory protein